MSKMAALGRRHFVGPFAAVGAASVPCETAEAFERAAADLAAGTSPALALVDQRFAGCEEGLRSLRGSGAAVVLLPAEPSEGHPALDEMRALIEAAAGANILGEY